MNTVFRIGTRGSHLALQQAREAVESLRKVSPHNHFELIVIQSTGDTGSRDEVGAFTAELERAVLDGRVHAAVHSCKDLPIVSDPQLHLAAVLPRASVADVLVSLDPQAYQRQILRVGTSSHRRKCILNREKPHWIFQNIHGNVDSRLKQLTEDSGLDAIIIAEAALHRGGFSLPGLHCEKIPLTTLLPAPAQGAIAIQCLKDGGELSELCTRISHRPTQDCISAEREFLRQLGGGCGSPFGCHAFYLSSHLHISAQWQRPDGVFLHGQWQHPDYAAFSSWLPTLTSQWLTQ